MVTTITIHYTGK